MKLFAVASTVSISTLERNTFTFYFIFYPEMKSKSHVEEGGKAVMMS